MKFLITLLLLTLVLGIQYVPIPAKPLGYIVKKNTSNVKIDAFFDLNCPDSRDQFFILDKLLTDMPDKFQLTIHQFPLPYHVSAMVAAAGFRYLQDNVPGLAAWEFARSMFTHLDELTNDANLDVTHRDWIAKIQLHAETEVYPKFNFDKVKFAQSLLPGSKESLQIRYQIKYAYSRGISGTPIFMLNQVIIDNSEKFNETDWTDFIAKRQ